MSKIKIPFIKSSHGNETFVVAIEGCNGVGKSTLLNNIKQRQDVFKCQLCVPEVYQTEKEMKRFMLFESSPLCSALYYLAGAVEIYETCKSDYPKLILDRSIWSTFAALTVKDDTLIPLLFGCLEAIKSHVYIPNLTVVLDASYQTSQMRITQKSNGAEYDKDEEDIFYRKRHFYQILKDNGYPVMFLDVNNLNPEEVYESFMRIIEDYTI